MLHYSKPILLSLMALLITACNQDVAEVSTDSVPASDSASVYVNLFTLVDTNEIICEYGYRSSNVLQDI